jgi:hypothetical protein
MEAQKRKGYCTALLQISSSVDVPESIAISAAVHMGHYVSKNWLISEIDPLLPGVSNSDKEFVRQNLLRKMFSSRQKSEIFK